MWSSLVGSVVSLSPLTAASWPWWPFLLGKPIEVRVVWDGEGGSFHRAKLPNMLFFSDKEPLEPEMEPAVAEEDTPLLLPARPGIEREKNIIIYMFVDFAKTTKQDTQLQDFFQTSNKHCQPKLSKFPHTFERLHLR